MGSYLIRCGRLFDGVEKMLRERMEIRVEGTQITAVGQGLVPKEQEQVIDLSNATVTPGLIDAHVHLSTFDWKRREYEMLYCSKAWKGMAVLYHAERALRRGFTTLRFMGCNCDDGYASLDAKRLIQQGYFPGADLVIAPYYVGSVGGMADAWRCAKGNPELSNRLTREYPGVGSGRDFFIGAVREQAKMGADFIKLMANGGFMSLTGGPGDVQLLDEEYAAVIETAHQCGIPVTAHAYTPATIRKLVDLGIDGIEHGSLLDEETAAYMRERGVYLVPTFMQYDGIVQGGENAAGGNRDAAFEEKLRTYAKQLRAGRAVIRNSGLMLGYGSDICDMYPCHECGREYSSWLESGFDPFQALMAATSVNADILGKQEIGRVLPGKRADLSAWSGDLLTEPQALMDCCFVMKGGTIYQTEKRGERTYES